MRRAAGGAPRKDQTEALPSAFLERRGGGRASMLRGGALLFSAAFLMPASSSGASGLSPIRSNLRKQRHWQLQEDPSQPPTTPPAPTARLHTHQEGITIFMLSVTGIRGLGRTQEGPSCPRGMREPSQRSQERAEQPLGAPPSRQGLCLRCCQATCHHVGLEAVVKHQQ